MARREVHTKFSAYRPVTKEEAEIFSTAKVVDGVTITVLPPGAAQKKRGKKRKGKSVL